MRQSNILVKFRRSRMAYLWFLILLMPAVRARRCEDWEKMTAYLRLPTCLRQVSLGNRTKLIRKQRHPLIFPAYWSWHKDQDILYLVPDKDIISSACATTLILFNVSVSDYGQYRCQLELPKLPYTDSLSIRLMPPRTLIRRRRAVIISETRDLGDNLWKENSYIKDVRMAAKGLNVTNCWLCMHVPGSGKGGNLWTQISRAAIPPLGIAMNYEDIHILNNFTVAMFNDTIRSIKMLNEEVSEIRQVTLQNRYALDIMLAAKGGVCALIHSHCCVFIHNYEPNITRTVHDMEDRIAEHEAGEDGFDKAFWALLWDWLPDSSWLRLLLQSVVVIVAILIMLCCCIQCIPNLFQMCTSAFQRMGPGREGTVYYATKTPPIFE